MDRFLLTMVVLAFFLLCVWGMRRGWRRKAREQSAAFDPFPAIPDEPGEELDALTGIYVATTRAGRWQERVVTRGVGMRGPATLRRYREGIAVDRDGATGFFIPAGSITGARAAKGMAGKVMGTEGLLVISWHLGDTELDTGFRADDVTAHGSWIESIRTEQTANEHTGGRQ